MAVSYIWFYFFKKITLVTSKHIPKKKHMHLIALIIRSPRQKKFFHLCPNHSHHSFFASKWGWSHSRIYGTPTILSCGMSTFDVYLTRYTSQAHLGYLQDTPIEDYLTCILKFNTFLISDNLPILLGHNFDSFWIFP